MGIRAGARWWPITATSGSSTASRWRTWPRSSPTSPGAQAANGPLRYGLSAFVVARDTDPQAQAEHERLIALAERDAAIRADTRARTDPAAAMFAKSEGPIRHVGTNGGTAAGLVGSYDTVAERIRAFHAAGIALFMLQFQPFEAEMRRFAQEILPRLR